MAGAPFTSLPIYNAAIASASASSSASPPPSTMAEAIHTSKTAPVINNSPKRYKSQQTPLTTPSVRTFFRLLCHSSRIGGVIGKSGSVIKHLQEDTSSTIRVDDAPPGSEFRVIGIVADSTVNRTMSFDEEHNGYAEISNVYTEVSSAQEALVRVFERILCVAAEDDGCYFAPGGVVSCRLLTNTSHVGFVIGKGGKVIEKIREDTGCKIRIFSQEKLPSCSTPSDEMIEIEGGVTAVKKALIAISRRIQDFTPSDKSKMTFVKPENLFNRESVFPNGRLDHHNGFNPVLPNRHVDHYPLTRPQNGFNPVSPNMHTDHQSHRFIAFRMLCTRELAGGIIGSRGTIIHAFENQTGASISVAYPVSNCNERLITITATESPESPNSPAQNAVILVFGRSVETAYEKGLDSPLSGTPILARLVIPHCQMGCLLGKGGSIMADMRKVTGAFIKIVNGNNFPSCATEYDEVVLMSGDFVNVRDALFSVTTRLRNHFFTSGPKTHGRALGQPSSEMHQFSQHASLTQSMDNLRFSNNVDSSSSSGPHQSQAGPSSVKSGIELGRGGRSAIITNTSVEIMVPQNDIGCVYGENESNLTRIRQISGAKVVVHEPGLPKGDYVIVISGTPGQTRSAQSLLQAFILADEH